ncbi:MAG: cation:proton antiporter [Campylobacterota bacterium]|nr:cation:proton antiporter [Campylobacterota bacterium]
MEHTAVGLYVLVFVIGSLIIGSITMMYTKGTKLPYTIALLLIGLALGGIERTGFFEHSMPIVSHALLLVADIDPHLILFIFLPTLIFESAYALEVHLFRRIFSQIAILAVPGLIISTLATAALVKIFFPWNWEWELALLFGALISATDPVAVVALLKEVSSRKRLETLIEGESLLNDGTAIVLFTLFLTMYLSTTNSDFSVVGVVGEFSFVVMFGLVIGVIFGYIAIKLIDKVFNNPLVEITLSVGVAYLVFFIAEHTFHVSGVVALVSLALMFATVGRTKISPEVAGFLHHFWEMMAHFANTFIFLIVGILIATRVKLDIGEYWIALIVLYIGITVIRGGSVAILTPILNRIGIGFTKAKGIVLVWGGLRGAVSLALALTIAQNDSIPKEIGDQILFLTAGIVVLTILINGLTMEKLLAMLHLDTLPPAKEITVQKAKANVYQNLVEYLPQIKKNEFLQNVNWDDIVELKELDTISNIDLDKKDVSTEELSIAYRRRLLESERKFYWAEFSKGNLSAEATNHLAAAIEQALDEYPTITPRPHIEELWHIPSYLHSTKDIPVVSSIMLQFSFSRLALGYEVARGFMNAQDEVLTHINSLGASNTDVADVKKDILKNIQLTYDYMENLNTIFPEIVCSIQTRTANRLLLNRERSVIEKLLKSGVLDKPEASRMIDDVENRMFELTKYPISIKPPELDTLVFQSSLINKLNKETIEKLSNAAKHQIYDKSDTIIKYADNNSSLMIVARGSVEIIDNVTNQVHNIVGQGAVLGINSVIKGFVEHTLKASTPAEILTISKKDIESISRGDDELMKLLTKEAQKNS